MTEREKPHSNFRHPAPRKHVLLLSCMDQRLLDDTVSFMDSYNLTNRYDQVVFAGAALGVMNRSSPPAQDASSASAAAWKDVFFDHLKVAIEKLGRKIKDIFILEHRDCGAYEHLHPTYQKPYCDDPCGQELERKHHSEQAFSLANAIRAYCQEQYQHAKEKALDENLCESDRIDAKERMKAWEDIKVKCFLMDLEGKVEHLIEPAAETPKVT